MLNWTIFTGIPRDPAYPLEFTGVMLATQVGNLLRGTAFDGATLDIEQSTLTFYNTSPDGDVTDHHSYKVRLSLDPNELPTPMRADTETFRL